MLKQGVEKLAAMGATKREATNRILNECLRAGLPGIISNARKENISTRTVDLDRNHTAAVDVRAAQLGITSDEYLASLIEHDLDDPKPLNRMLETEKTAALRLRVPTVLAQQLGAAAERVGKTRDELAREAFEAFIKAHKL